MKTCYYAAYNRDPIIHKKGSSGSIYFSIAKWVLDCKGVVCAAVYDDYFNVKHMIIDSMETLYLSMGSKYVASEIGDSFNVILEHLSNGRKVLFVGTPCQCAGLYSFINLRNSNYLSELIIIDIVCQGVPSPMVWQKYLKEKQERHQVCKINMRDKSNGWLNYSFYIKYDDEKEEIEARNQNAYLKGFIQCYFLRPSCYHCRFKGDNRYSDITLGDLWGCDQFNSELYQYDGTSLVICRTNKGKRIFESLNSQIVISLLDDEYAVKKNNRCLIESVQMPEKRKIFFDLLQNNVSYSDALLTINHKNIIQKICSKVRYYLSRISL